MCVCVHSSKPLPWMDSDLEKSTTETLYYREICSLDNSVYINYLILLCVTVVWLLSSRAIKCDMSHEPNERELLLLLLL